MSKRCSVALLNGQPSKTLYNWMDGQRRMPFNCDFYQPYQRKTRLEEIIFQGLNSIIETNRADSIHPGE